MLLHTRREVFRQLSDLLGRLGEEILERLSVFVDTIDFGDFDLLFRWDDIYLSESIYLIFGERCLSEEGSFFCSAPETHLLESLFVVLDDIDVSQQSISIMRVKRQKSG